MRSWIVAALIITNLALVVASNVSFKFSAQSPGWRGFLAWQVIGNLAGFTSVLTLTALLRQIPMHLAYALSAGLGFVLVQVVGARLIFHETISDTQWLGVTLVASGIVLICRGA